MFVAGDWNHIGPISWCHDDSSDLGAGNVEGGGTFLVWALDAGAAVLIGILAVAEHTLLQWKQKIDNGQWLRPETKPLILKGYFFFFHFGSEGWDPFGFHRQINNTTRHKLLYSVSVNKLFQVWKLYVTCERPNMTMSPTEASDFKIFRRITEGLEKRLMVMIILKLKWGYIPFTKTTHSSDLART